MPKKKPNLNVSFGAASSKHDPRTITSDMVATNFDLPEKAKIPLDFDFVDDLCDQRKLGVCTKCAQRMAQEESKRDGVRLSEYWGYLMQKCFYDDVEYKEHFEGSSAFTALRTAHTYGSPSKDMERKFPLKVDGTYDEFMTHFRMTYGGVIPQEVLDDAAKRKIKGYYYVKVDPLTIASEISKGKIVIIRMAVGDNFYRDKKGRSSRKAKDLLPLRAPTTIDSGHLMVLNEYRGLDFNQLLAGPNSWSRTWCPDNKDQEAGYFNFIFKTQAPYFTEAWAIEDDSTKFVFKNDLRLGMQNPEVVMLQKVLVEEGFLKMPAGVSYGYFGNLTLAAVQKYQKAHKITPQSGFVGPLTRAELNK